MLWDVEIISSELNPFVKKNKKKIVMDGRRAVAKLQGEDTLPRGGGSKIKTNPLIFLCQVITVRPNTN